MGDNAAGIVGIGHLFRRLYISIALSAESKHDELTLNHHTAAITIFLDRRHRMRHHDKTRILAARSKCLMRTAIGSARRPLR